MGQNKKAEKNPLTVHVVGHTHWDREWYHTAALFGQRLVPLIDSLLESIRGDAKLRFLLDGQAVVLEDYLAMRPENARALAANLRSGAIEAGPWYVLADELIPSGEAMLRNLFAGRRVLASMNARAPNVLYCPDSFGHPAALPAIADGFGCDLIVLWRGFGGASHPPTNCAVWRAPDGSSALVYHLPRSGYELGAALPTTTTDAQIRWEWMRDALQERDRLGVVLLTNGADHHALQPASAQAVRLLSQVARPDIVLRSSLSRFAAALVGRARKRSLPAVSGELRDSYGYTWTLQGTFASRSQLKRSLALASRTLTREAEPWSALACAQHGKSRRHLLHAAWKPLLLTLPHDTICGCSIDEVATEASLRLRDALDKGREIARDSLEQLAGYHRAAVRDRANDPGSDVVLLTNPSAEPRGGVAEVLLVQKRRDVRVGPGSALQPRPLVRAPVPKSFTALNDKDQARLPVQLLGAHSRYDLIESPQHYPDADIVMDRRLLIWAPPIPGYGFDTLRPSSAAAAPDAGGPANPARALDRSVANGIVSAGITNDNRIWLAAMGKGDPGDADVGSRKTTGKKRDEIGAQIAFISVEDRYDAGDLYTPSLRHSPTIVDRVRSWRTEASGPLRSSLVVRFEWTSHVEKGASSAIVIPAANKRDARGHGRRINPLRGWLQVVISVDADCPSVRLDVTGDNRTKHHRLRLLISSDLEGCSTLADAALAVVERSAIIAEVGATEMETPPATAPLHRFVSLLTPASGMTVFSNGASEYESDSAGCVALTLVRAVGELSRHDLPERPGHAGWPANTPLAQEQGPFHCAFAWMPHSSGDWNKIAQDVEREANGFLHPLSGITLRSAIAVPPRTTGAELTGAGLSVSAIKESEDGRALLLRCVNLTTRRVSASWRLGHEIATAHLARLDETPQRKLRVKGGDTIPFVVPPSASVSILVTRKKRR